MLNRQSNISCTIKDRGYFGYLHWDGGYTDMAYVDDVPRHARFRKGDYVVTSGYSEVFPAGIMVGQVKYVFNSADGLSFRLKVKLATDFGNLPARRIAECHHHRHGGVAGSVLLSLVQLFLHVDGKSFHITHDAESHVVLHEDLVFE